MGYATRWAWPLGQPFTSKRSEPNIMFYGHGVQLWIEVRSLHLGIACLKRDGRLTLPDKSSIRSLTIGERKHLGSATQAIGRLTRLATNRMLSLPPCRSCRAGSSDIHGGDCRLPACVATSTVPDVEYSSLTGATRLATLAFAVPRRWLAQFRRARGTRT